MLVTPVSWSRTPCSTCNICLGPANSLGGHYCGLDRESRPPTQAQRKPESLDTGTGIAVPNPTLFRFIAQPFLFLDGLLPKRVGFASWQGTGSMSVLWSTAATPQGTDVMRIHIGAVPRLVGGALYSTDKAFACDVLEQQEKR